MSVTPSLKPKRPTSPISQRASNISLSRNDSSYFVPNYPLREPVFFVPTIPSITKVPEPKPPKKTPIPGFDMKTLREQLKILTADIEEKIYTQSLLYMQNEQLWVYIQDLLEANKSNARLMREEVLKLHTELRNAHRERYEIAQQLQIARNSKQMLNDLNIELAEVHMSVEEVARRKKEAEDALYYAKEENSHLEEVLMAKSTEMKEVHLELEEYRRRKAEENALDIADDFFYTNRQVLRSAYYRFRSGVQRRFRLHRIFTSVQRAYLWHLKHFSVRVWSRFVQQQRLVHEYVRQRNGVLLEKCFFNWGLMKLAESARRANERRRTVNAVFTAWRGLTREIAFDKWSVAVTKELHDMQFVRKIFHAWKRKVIFLDWNHPALRVMDGQAQVFFKRTLFQAWATVAKRESEKLNYQATLVPLVVAKFHLEAWKGACRLRWRQRGRLLRRFIRNLKRNVEEKTEHAVTYKHSYAAWCHFKLKKAVRYWTRYIRNRRMFVTTPPKRPAAAFGLTATNPWGLSVSTGNLNGLLREASGSGSALNTPTWRSQQMLGSSATLPLRITNPMTPSTPHFAMSYSGKGGAAPLGTDTTEPLLARTLSNPSLRGGGIPGAPSTTEEYVEDAFNTLHSAISNANYSGIIQTNVRHTNVIRTTGRNTNRWQQNRSQQVLTHMSRRWLNGALLQWIYATSVNKRQRLCEQSSVRHCVLRTAHVALSTWHRRVRQDIRRRVKHQRRLYRTIVTAWRKYVGEMKRERRIQQGLQSMEVMRRQQLQARTFRDWQTATRRRLRLLRSGEYLQQKLAFNCVKKTFISWRNKWSKALFWRLKELEIEYSRSKAMSEVHKRNLEDLRYENLKAKNEKDKLEQNLASLQTNLADANNSNRRKEEEILLKEAEKEQALLALEGTQHDLQEAMTKCEEMRIFEDLVVKELEQQHAERIALQRAAEEVVQRVHSESDVLRGEVRLAREQSSLSERQAEEEIRRGEDELRRLQEGAVGLQHLLLNRREHLEQLEGEQRSLLTDLQKVQQKVGDVTRDGAALIAENEALIRSKGSAVRVLKQNVGLMQARNRATEEVLNEGGKEINRMRMSELMDSNTTELLQLQAMKQHIEAELSLVRDHGIAATTTVAPLNLSSSYDHYPASGLSLAAVGGSSAAGARGVSLSRSGLSSPHGSSAQLLSGGGVGHYDSIMGLSASSASVGGVGGRPARKGDASSPRVSTAAATSLRESHGRPRSPVSSGAAAAQVDNNNLHASFSRLSRELLDRGVTPSSVTAGSSGNGGGVSTLDPSLTRGRSRSPSGRSGSPVAAGNTPRHPRDHGAVVDPPRVAVGSGAETPLRRREDGVMRTVLGDEIERTREQMHRQEQDGGAAAGIGFRQEMGVGSNGSSPSTPVSRQSRTMEQVLANAGRSPSAEALLGRLQARRASPLRDALGVSASSAVVVDLADRLGQVASQRPGRAHSGAESSSVPMSDLSGPESFFGMLPASAGISRQVARMEAVHGEPSTQRSGKHNPQRAGAALDPAANFSSASSKPTASNRSGAIQGQSQISILPSSPIRDGAAAVHPPRSPSTFLTTAPSDEEEGDDESSNNRAGSRGVRRHSGGSSTGGPVRGAAGPALSAVAHAVDAVTRLNQRSENGSLRTSTAPAGTSSSSRPVAHRPRATSSDEDTSDSDQPVPPPPLPRFPARTAAGVSEGSEGSASSNGIHPPAAASDARNTSIALDSEEEGEGSSFEYGDYSIDDGRPLVAASAGAQPPGPRSSNAVIDESEFLDNSVNDA